MHDNFIDQDEQIMHGFTWFNLIPFVNKYATEEHIHVVTAAFVVLLCMILAVLMSVKLKKLKSLEVPDARFNFRNVIELLAEMIYSLVSEIMGEHDARKFFPALASIFLFILFNNLLGLLPGFQPATDNINTTFACGVFIFIYYNYVGFREQGISYIKHFMGPILWLAPLMFPHRTDKQCGQAVLTGPPFIWEHDRRSPDIEHILRPCARRCSSGFFGTWPVRVFLSGVHIHNFIYDLFDTGFIT